jgi:hypothetical protein
MGDALIVSQSTRLTRGSNTESGDFADELSPQSRYTKIMKEFVALLLLLATALSACRSEPEAADGRSAQREEEEKRKDPVAGVAANLGGIRGGNDSGFSAAAEATR